MSGPTPLVLQARMGSTRLPGKSMLDLAGAPLLGRILERVQRCREAAPIVVATTREPEDDVLAELGERYGVVVFRGSETDLVDRYVQVARALAVNAVGRLPADNPVPEPEEIDRIVAYHRSSGNAFSSNLAEVLGNGYPDGIGAEVFDVAALEAVWETVDDPVLREHPHRSFYDYDRGLAVDPKRFPVGTVECPAELRRPDLVLDVNTREQYEVMCELYEALYPLNPEFRVTEVIRWFDENERPR
ncbi:MAG TPA: NTP transferase domain-containing protein [Gaiellaceae bacterium]|nr:NTP transferase domain-containing protein [Gaiellaceae bacterium]